MRALLLSLSLAVGAAVAAAEPAELTDEQKRSLPFGDYNDYSDLKVDARRISGRVWLLTHPEARQGALVTAWIGEQEIVLVDTGYPEGAPAVLAALRTISDRPVTTVIATHWHADHIGASAFWKEQGAEIIAHERTRDRRTIPQTIPAFGKTYPPLPEAARPDKTFAERMTLYREGERMELIHSRGHTDGDILVRFAAANVFALGDLSFGRQYPFMDVESGGSWPALVRTFEAMLALSDERTGYVPGHLIRGSDETPVLTYSDVVDFTAMLKTVERRVADQIGRGLSLEEAIRERPLADLEARWQRSPAVTSASIVSAAYRSIARDGANPDARE